VLYLKSVYICIHRELNTLGSRAFSHESVFIPEESEKTHPGQTMSQENVSDKVKNIQVKLLKMDIWTQSSHAPDFANTNFDNTRLNFFYFRYFCYHQGQEMLVTLGLNV